MNASAMKIAELVWNGPPDDPMEYALDCPHCGETPEWERDGKYSSRLRLNCCRINNASHGYYKGREADAVINWNEAVAWETEALRWAKEEAESEARHAAEDAWVDAHIPAAA